ncbi:MAG: MYXO-CTERM sorting domain-containing protein [Polyangiaceae bacterium]
MSKRASRFLTLTPLTALGLLLAAAPAAAAEWHRPAGAPAFAGSPRVAAESWLESARAELDLDGIELAFQGESRVGKHHTARFTQTMDGLPVLGSTAAVRVSAAGRIEVAVLEIGRHLVASTSPTLDDASARTLVDQRRGMSSPSRASLGVLPGNGGTLVWVVDAGQAHEARRYLVDAHDGRALGERPLAMHAKGRVYPISSVVTPETQDVDLLELVASTPQKLNGWNGQLTVTNFVSEDAQGALTVAQDLVPNVGEDFLYDPPADFKDATDAFAQVGVYYHLTRMKSFFGNTFGLDMSAPSWKVTAAVNLQSQGMPLDNAYFSPEGTGGDFASPNLIGIGQGSFADFADDSDVFLHEFTHYVSHNAVGYNEGQLGTSEYGLSPFGGSIDEGISDYFACTVNGDPILGEASLGVFDQARDLTKTDKKCPDDVIGEVHADGEIIGSTAWSVRVALGAELADQLVWGSVSLLTHGASLGDFAAGLKQTAADLVADGVMTAADAAKVDEAVAKQQLDDCDHELAIDADDPERKTTLIGLDVLAQLGLGNCQQLKQGNFVLQSYFHFVAAPAPGDTALRFAVALDDMGDGGELDWNIYARKDEHVGFANNGFLPSVSQFDWSAEHLTTKNGELIIDASSTPPFDPNATYHMVIGNSNCPITVATITATVPTSSGEGGAGGDGGAGPASSSAASTASSGGTGGQATPAEDDGCGCRIPGGSPPAPRSALLGLALAALVAGARRRRAS